MKIVFIGNSVSLRVRPFQKEDLAFPFIVEKKLADKNAVYFDLLGGQMIDKYVSNPDFIFEYNADVIILNFGIVELSSRSISRRFYEYLNYRTPKKKWKRKIQTIFQFLENRFRKTLVNMKGRSSWYNKDLFIDDYLKLIESIQDKSNSKLIVLGINEPDKRIEDQLPGTKNRVNYVNMKLKIELEKVGVQFIDVNSITKVEDRPDGIHYNSKGHLIISSEIIKLIEAFSKS
jgi:hypothetical protein